MTADERLALLAIKVERAKKHFADLNSAVRVFFDSKPYKIGTKHDPDTRKLIYYMSAVEPVPPIIGAITGDILNNLGSALDHLARQLLIVGGTHRPELEFYFPIRNKASDYKSAIKGIEKTLRQDAIEALRNVEAYKGGNGHNIWVLNRLNNIDKHRLLVTVSSHLQSVNLGADLWMKANARWPGIMPKIDAYFGQANVLPLKIGDELFIDSPDAKVNKEMDFRFNVALYEPGVVESKPLIETAQHLCDLVANIIALFKPCLG